MSIQARGLEALDPYVILAPGTIDAAADTTAVDLFGIDGDALFLLSYTASAGATGISVKIQHGNESNGSDAADVPAGAFEDLADAAGIQAISVDRSELGRYLRLSFTDEVGSYSATVSCVAVGCARYQS